MDAEVVQCLPCINSAIVTVAESRADGIVAHWSNIGDGDVFLTQLQHFLSGSMAPDFGGGGVYPQIFAGQFKLGAIVEVNFEDGGLLVEFDVGGRGCGHKPFYQIAN